MSNGCPYKYKCPISCPDNWRTCERATMENKANHPDKKITLEAASYCRYCNKPIGIKGFDNPKDDCCIECWRTEIKPTTANY